MPWLALLGKLHPRTILMGVMGLAVPFLLWHNQHLSEKVYTLSLQVHSLEMAREAAAGRADQASAALSDALKANKALGDSEKALRARLRTCQGERVRKASEGSVEACRAVQRSIHDHLYH